MTLQVWSNAQILAQIGSGQYWSGSTITYSFPTTSANFSDQTTAAGFSGFSAQQQGMGTLAIGLWGDIIARNLVFTTATNSNIEMANSTSTAMGGSYAYTYFPQDGTAWFNSSYNGISGGATNDLMHPVIGKHGFATFVHELGHAFGLDHAGNYNAGVGTPAPTNFQDSTVYSIMSYFGPSSGDGTDAVTSQLYSTEVAWGKWDQGYDPQTPMLDDIMVMQSAYGASTTTRAGDTVYGFHSNITGSEASIYDFNTNQHPILCIYDSSGNDTLDLSGYTTASKIDLNPGAFSDCEGMTKNISIAYTAIIENAVGGAGNDTILGNGAGDKLNGGAGNDTITGGAGNDIIIGGSGADTINGGGGINTASYVGSATGVTVNLTLVGVAQVSGGDAAGDILTNIQNLTGSSFNDTMTGDANNNTFQTGGGSDHINGGGGNDTISFASNAVGVQVNLGAYAPGSGNTWDGTSMSFLTGIENVIGSAGNDILTGDVNNNVINGGLGNNTMTGGGGADTFRFTDLNFGVDTVTDYAHFKDHLSFSGSVANAFTDFVVSNNDTTNVVLNLMGGGTILLHDTIAIHIDATDFFFV